MTADPVADGVAYGPEDPAGEASPVLHAPAVGVVTAVELGAQEGTEQIVVPDVHLDAVETGFDGDEGGPSVVLGDAVDVACGGGAQARAHRGPAAGGRESRGTVGAGIGHRAGVPDLRGGCRALGVHGIGEAAQSRQGRLVEEEAVPIGAAFGRHGQVGHGAHGGPTLGDPAMELDELVADLAPRHDPFEGGGFDDAVAEGDRTQGGGGEDLGWTWSRTTGCGHGWGSLLVAPASGLVAPALPWPTAPRDARGRARAGRNGGRG